MVFLIVFKDARRMRISDYVRPPCLGLASGAI